MTDVFHKSYGELSDTEKAVMSAIKDAAEVLYGLIDSQTTPERNEANRCYAVAKTELETAVMWAIKGVTTK